MRTHLLMVERVGGDDEARVELHALQQQLIHETEQVCIAQATVPVLYNVAAVHDLAKDVAQVFPRNLCV